jgi:hypothetical protein
MAHSWKSAALLIMVWIVPLLQAHANDTTSVVRDLGKVSGADPAKSSRLKYALLNEPKDRVRASAPEIGRNQATTMNTPGNSRSPHVGAT